MSVAEDYMIDGVRPRDSLNAPSGMPRDVPFEVNVEAFERQIACFDRMRETNLAYYRAHHKPDAATLEWNRMREKNAQALNVEFLTDKQEQR